MLPLTVHVIVWHMSFPATKNDKYIDEQERVRDMEDNSFKKRKKNTSQLRLWCHCYPDTKIEVNSRIEKYIQSLSHMQKSSAYEQIKSSNK